MNNNSFSLYKSAKKYIVYSLIAFFIFWIFDFEILKYLSVIAMVSFIFLFRNPFRSVSSYEKNRVLAPVDGKVISIEDIDDKYFTKKIEIDSTCFNVAVLYSPMRCIVTDIIKTNGAKLPSSDSKFKKLNENITLIFENEDKHKLKINHLTKFSFSDIDIDLFVKQKLEDGTVYGFMLNGITTIYIPKDFKLNLSVGSEIVATQTIGYF